jgi:hypothetical protein
MPRNPFAFKAVARPPGVPRRTQFPSPGKAFGQAGRTQLVGGPEAYIKAHPELFGGATVSASEGYVYWALLRVLGPEGPDSGWEYQGKFAGGRHLPGGAMPDFIIYARNPAIIFRVQGSRFHSATSPRGHAIDEDQKRAMEQAGYIVVDLWDEYWINDKSGQAVIIQVKEGLDGRQRPSPITSGASLARPGELRAF